MLLVREQRTFERAIGGGTDGVVAVFGLPSGTVVHRCTGYIMAEGESLLTAQKVTAFGVEAHVLPVLDPDAATVPDTIWDALVVKDTNADVLDLDTAAADATPFWEPGEHDWANVFEVGLQPRMVSHQHRYFGLGHGAIFQNQDNQTPFAVEWIPGGRFEVKIGSFRVTQPSYLMIGCTSPSLDQTTTTLPGVVAEDEWPRMKYLQLVLEQAMIHVLGLVESGAETPWEEATLLISQQLDPLIFESDSAFFTAGGWRSWGEINCDMSVTGELGKPNLRAF